MEAIGNVVTVELSLEDVELIRSSLSLMLQAEDDPDLIDRLKRLIARLDAIAGERHRVAVFQR